MKLGKYLILSFICLSFIGCYYFPCAWSESPQSFTFTLDKYEARIGDEITIDTGDIKAFDSKENHIYCLNEGTVSKDFDLVRKIDSSKAVFKISDDAFSGTLNWLGDITQEVQEDCYTQDVWYGSGYSDKELKITK